MAAKLLTIALLGLFCLLVFLGCQALQRSASRPQAKFHLIDGGHNDWSFQPDVLIRNP